MGIRQIREWLDQPCPASRQLAAEGAAAAEKARRRIAELEQELRDGGCRNWYAQEVDRARDDLDYALQRGPYAED